MLKHIIIIMTIMLTACHKSSLIQDMPHAVTNNAVALVKKSNETELYSFNGLSSGKTWKDINNLGYVYKNNNWSEIAMPKSSNPVLASIAVSIDSTVYLIGGYTVDAKKEEKSVDSIFALNTQTQQWRLATKMPVAVDDTVALVYANRYIYLISGWHDIDNVSAVQVYDTQTDLWFNATNYPAPAVFGHSGGIVANQMLICDGVKVVVKDKGRDFVASPVCVKGVIDEKQPEKINWKTLSHYSQKAHYRMASVGDVVNNRIVFAGGSDNPYNYDGIGYNSVPSDASNDVYVYDLVNDQWETKKTKNLKSMDHRGLLTDGIYYYIIGGMGSHQEVLSKVQYFQLNEHQ